MASKISRHRLLIAATIAMIVLFIAMAFIFIRIIELKVVEGAKYVKDVETLSREEEAPATRGSILAVDGRTMACSLPNYRVCMDPNADGLTDEIFNSNIDALAAKLSSFFRDKSISEYKSLISRARLMGRRYLIINNRRISYNELLEVRQFPIFNLGRNKGGLNIEESGQRARPFGILASRTIGKLYQDEAKGGINGIEQAYNKELCGVPGRVSKMRITGRWINKEIVAPTPGLDVRTTIDVDFQDVAELSLMRQLEKHNAEHGVAILMEVKTGAVRAMVNLYRRENGTYTEDNFNYAIGELAEPGSTFKLATVMACLEDDMFDVEDTINTFNGEYKFYDAVMHDSHKDGGIMSIRKAFEASSNVAFSRLVQKHYASDPKKFIEGLRDLGLCDSLGIDIKGEGATHIKDVSDPTWSGTSLPWMSIGYELQITPLHLLTLYNAVANNGQMMRPMFVEALMDHGREVKTFRPKVLRSSIASHSTIRTVQSLLKGVVEHGTAKNISGTPYKIAGKTGTAQIANKGGYGGQGSKKYLASFAGYFPADNPMYSCIVMVYGPNNNVYYGNVVAGSVVKAIADRVYAAEYRKGNVSVSPKIAESEVYPYSKGGQTKDVNIVFGALRMPHTLDISPKSWVSATAQGDMVALRPRHFVKNIMPDVRGMGAADAVSLLESMGLRVNISGYGRVSSQSPASGTSFVRGSVAQIQLTN
ncbi:MAG: transpeptidase family protein [Bacteroidales bacterium]|nr:transpeptidase family protein [Bacteroidales bacterium]